MYKNKKVNAIVLAAGSGNRFGSELNKVYAEINGKPIIEYSLEKFKNNSYIDKIIIVIKQGEEALCDKSLLNSGVHEKVNIVIGGATRQESVYNALRAIDSRIGLGRLQDDINPSIAIIHDGARPFVTEKMIKGCIESMDKFKGVTIGVKSKDTIKITDEEGVVVSTTTRKNTWIIQTPQCFDKGLLLQAHETTFEEGVEITDDCMLMELMGEKIKIIDGEYTNIKVTTKEDIDIANKYVMNV